MTELRFSFGGRIAMRRVGKYNTEMVFEQQQRHICYYTTPTVS